MWPTVVRTATPLNTGAQSKDPSNPKQYVWDLYSAFSQTCFIGLPQIRTWMHRTSLELAVTRVRLIINLLRMNRSKFWCTIEFHNPYARISPLLHCILYEITVDHCYVKCYYNIDHSMMAKRYNGIVMFGPFRNRPKITSPAASSQPQNALFWGELAIFKAWFLDKG